MMETGKTYKHVASGRVIRVDYVGSQIAIATTLEVGNVIADIGNEIVIRLPEAGWQKYTPPKVYAKTVTIGVSSDDTFCIHTQDVDFLEPGYRIGTVTIAYTEGGKLTAKVEQDV